MEWSSVVRLGTLQDEVTDGSLAFIEGLNEVKQDKIDALKDIVSSKGELVHEAASKVVDKVRVLNNVWLHV